jgi:uncharacterized iron-regulated protein
MNFNQQHTGCSIVACTPFGHNVTVDLPARRAPRSGPSPASLLGFAPCSLLWPRFQQEFNFMIKQLFVAATCAFSVVSAANVAAQTTPAAVAQHYAALVHANYEDALTTARQMQQAIAAFTAQPSTDTLAAARKA